MDGDRLFYMVFDNLLLPEAKGMSSPLEKKVCALALARLLGECSNLRSPDYIGLW
jgi:hypothetical protein